ncbi:MAG: hypothetical protein Q9184_007191, partial [Pyrenodesmia sp. 2 TL-2023]
MTAQVLTTELASLIQESKKKYPDLRNAAEYSLAELKALPNTSEAQLAAALDVQLKVLQALPLLLQNYATELRGPLLISAFQVCFLLQGSKTAVVSRTAAASLQQFLAFTFDKVVIADDSNSSEEPLQSVSAQEGSVSVSSAAADAYHLLEDFSLLACGKQPNIYHGVQLSSAFALELIESILASHIDTVAKHEEQIHVCRTRLVPHLITILTEEFPFAPSVRAMRLLRLLTSKLLSVMAVELEVALNQLHYMLDPAALPAWKRAVALEFFSGVYSDSSLVRELYAQYDEHKERRNIIGDHLALLVRLAAENSAVIGLGQHLSQFEVYEDLHPSPIALESAGTGPLIESSLKKRGLSPHWSIARTRFIDQADKTEPLELPATYLHALVLTCINSFAEGLAKFLLPFTVPSGLKQKQTRKTTSSEPRRGDSKADDNGGGSGTKAGDPVSAESPLSEGKLPINPMTLENHELYSQICTAASMVEQCWPALLATFSTFLNASLDSEYLHALIRSFQRFTQVAGLLRLATPRDAFLTALAKQAVPTLAANPSKASGPGVHGESESDTDRDPSDGEPDPSPAPSVSFEQKKQASQRSTLIVTRNLLCLRALLNLGIALGPVLTDSWTIILETLHQFDVALLAYQTQKPLSGGHDSRGSIDQNNIYGSIDDNEIDSERKAVETAVARLFQSTSELPDQAFLHILNCLSSLTYGVSNLPKPAENEAKVDTTGVLSPQPVTMPQRHRFPSTSSIDLHKALGAKNSICLLDRISHVAECNASRLRQVQPSSSGWSILTTLFIDHLSSPAVVAEIRISAARMLNNLVIQLLSASKEDSLEHRDRVIGQGIDALATAVSSLGQSDDTKAADHCSLEIYAMAFEALTLLLEQHGEVMRSGWDTVFYIINSIFVIDEQPLDEGGEGLAEMAVSASRSPRLLRPSFAALQLLCSDFPTSIPKSCFPTLLDSQYYFASQHQDFNISLTSISLFRSTSDYLQRDQTDSEGIKPEAKVAGCETEKDLVELMKGKRGNRSRSAIWVYLLLRLAHLMTDSRPEVRHSALHTMFGIIDAWGNQLSAEAWTMCFRLVFFQLLSSPELKQQASTDEDSWEDTAILLVQGLSKTFMQSLDTLTGPDNYPPVWNQLLVRYGDLLRRRGLGLSRAVFNSLAEVLAAFDRTYSAHRMPLDSDWLLWRDHNPATYGLQGNADNKEALEAYLKYIRQLRGLVDGRSSAAQAETVLANLRLCITNSTPLTYGSDVDEMTNVQKLVLENIGLIPMPSSDIVVKVAMELAYLVTLAFQTNTSRVDKGKTLVALARAAMDALKSLVVEQRSVKSDAALPRLLSISLAALN